LNILEVFYFYSAKYLPENLILCIKFTKLNCGKIFRANSSSDEFWLWYFLRNTGKLVLFIFHIAQLAYSTSSPCFLLRRNLSLKADAVYIIEAGNRVPRARAKFKTKSLMYLGAIFRTEGISNGFTSRGKRFSYPRVR